MVTKTLVEKKEQVCICMELLWSSDRFVFCKEQIPVRKFNPKTEMMKSCAFADIIDGCSATTSNPLEAFDFHPLKYIYYVDYEDRDPGKWGKSAITIEKFLERAGTHNYPNLKNTIDKAINCIKEEYRGEGTLCAIQTRRGWHEPPEPATLDLFAFPLNISNPFNTPYPVLPVGSKAKPVYLTDLVVAIRTKVGFDPEDFSLSKIDDAAFSLFLDASTSGRTARMYWQVWNRARTFHVQ